MRHALTNGTVWQLALLLGLTTTAGLAALSFWLPQIVKAFSGLSDLGVGFVSAVPYLTAAVAMGLVGAHSDRTRERWLPIAACSATAAVGFLVSASVHAPALALMALSVAAAGILGSCGPFWTLPRTFLSGEAAAAGIAVINAAAHVMGFLVPYALGLLREATGSYHVGLAFLAMLPCSGAMLALTLRRAPVFQPGVPPLVPAVTA